MHFRTIALLLSLAVPSAVHAEDPRAAVRAACQGDVKSNCGIIFNRDKALECLIDNAGKLSGGCSSALKKASCNPQAPANVKSAFPCAE